MLVMVGETSSGSCPRARHALGTVGGVKLNQSFHPLAVRCYFRCRGCSRYLSAQGLDDAPRRDVPRTSDHDMERLTTLVVTGLRVRVVIYYLQCSTGILELHLYVFLILRVHFLFALLLVGRRAILALLLHLFVELFCEFLDLPALRCTIAREVVHQALRATVVAIGQLTGAFVTYWPPTAPTHRCSCGGGCSS
jgi:hypothetical protein